MDASSRIAIMKNYYDNAVQETEISEIDSLYNFRSEHLDDDGMTHIDACSIEI